MHLMNTGADVGGGGGCFKHPTHGTLEIQSTKTETHWLSFSFISSVSVHFAIHFVHDCLTGVATFSIVIYFVN